MTNTIKTFNACINDMQKMRGFYIFLRDHYKKNQKNYPIYYVPNW